MADAFYNLHNHGFIRVATATPFGTLAAPVENAAISLELIKKAQDEGASLVLFPELSLSGYSLDDLFFQDVLLEACEKALATIVEESEKLNPVIIIGMPLLVRSRLYNVAVIIHKGDILGVVPKLYLPNYREFYEKRQFSSGFQRQDDEVFLLDDYVPFGEDLLFKAHDFKDFTFGIEICEDLWVPSPPSNMLAMAGAHVIANLSASNITVGKSDYRHKLCEVQSVRTYSAYLYCAAGRGESTTDLAWDGHAMIYENGELLAESERFLLKPHLTLADIDLEKLRQERMRHSTFSDCSTQEKATGYREVGFILDADKRTDLGLLRRLDRFPYVPNDPEKLHETCFEAYHIQVSGLVKRLQSSGIDKIVIGISGGLDSTHALLVAVQAFDELKIDRKNILAYTLPAFATSKSTNKTAHALMEALGVSAQEIDMVPQSEQMLKDIGHAYAKGEKLYDVTFENVQAGARTSLLFRLANQHNALVLGTGDLSELALGWCTYGVGDHMSHYNVNASVSKTLIQHLIRWVARSHRFGEEASLVLVKVLETEISPELVPSDDKSKPAQHTESFIGPYELQDFNLFYISRFSFRPSKVAFLAYHAWKDKMEGTWPENIKEENKNAYALKEIKKWLNVFVWRFFKTSQFKRSAIPNGPKVASGGSLSPRGDWRAPSDNSAEIWLKELKDNVPE